MFVHNEEFHSEDDSVEHVHIVELEKEVIELKAKVKELKEQIVKMSKKNDKLKHRSELQYETLEELIHRIKVDAEKAGAKHSLSSFEYVIHNDPAIKMLEARLQVLKKMYEETSDPYKKEVLRMKIEGYKHFGIKDHSFKK